LYQQKQLETLATRNDCLLNNGSGLLARMQLGRDATDLRTTVQPMRSRREFTMTRLHQRRDSSARSVDEPYNRPLAGHIVSHPSIRSPPRSRNHRQHSVSFRFIISIAARHASSSEKIDVTLGSGVAS